MKSFKQHLDERCWPGYKSVPGKKAYSPGSCVKEEVEELEEGNQPKTEKKPSKNKNVKRPEVATFSHMIDLRHLNLLKKPKKMAKEEYEADDGPLTQEQLEQLEEGEAWTRKEGQSESGGLNRKGIESYRRANPGSKLSMAVTTKPSKLKAGSKAANRRKSFCARMGGMKRRLTSAKTARDPDSRINKALRKWNC
jgi:hypothetical protein